MRITTFTRTGATHVGVLDPTAGTVVSLGRASGGDPRFGSVLALVRGGDAALVDARELAASHPADAAYDVDAVTLRAPLPDPPRVHGRPVTGPAAASYGPGDVVRPAPALALAGVVASTGALYGATILAGAQGPVLVTADELAEAIVPAAEVAVRVNGAAHARAAVLDVLAGLEQAVAATRDRRPGDLVVLDLPVATDPRALRDGDEIEIEVAGLGLLRNRIQL